MAGEYKFHLSEVKEGNMCYVFGEPEGIFGDGPDPDSRDVMGLPTAARSVDLLVILMAFVQFNNYY